MNTIKKYTSRSLWLAGLMLTTLLTGCNGGGSSTSTVPTVVETAPADAATDVATNSKVVVTFSEAMDATTISTTDTTTFTNFTVDAGGSVFGGAVEYDLASKTATFTPLVNFTGGANLTATVTTGVKSASGIPLAAPSVWHFTVSTAVDGTETDNISPTVISTNPVDGSAGFALNRNVTANFSESLAPATVDSSSFTLSVGTVAGGAPVPGVVSYSNKVATFNPTDNLDITTDYFATLTTGITDIANPGNVLTSDFTWTFKTGNSVANGLAPVNLGTAGDFIILAKTGITMGSSNIYGDIGVSPAASSYIVGNCVEIDPNKIYGVTIQSSDSRTCYIEAKTKVDNAVLDMGIAYRDAAGRTLPDFTELHAGDISGKTLVPGLYKWGTDVLINTDVTLSGDANAVWIFQISKDLLVGPGAKVLLSPGADPKNIFWQVAGGTGVSINTTAHLEGVVLAAKGITVNTGATIKGRLLADSAVTLLSNTVTLP